jgi:hypothetical protein
MASGEGLKHRGHRGTQGEIGSSPFFAAWRPYVFSQLGKAVVQGLYHCDYGADAQFGEVDYNTGALQLSTLLTIDKNTRRDQRAGSDRGDAGAPDYDRLERICVAFLTLKP